MSSYDHSERTLFITFPLSFKPDSLTVIVPVCTVSIVNVADSIKLLLLLVYQASRLFVPVSSRGACL